MKDYDVRIQYHPGKANVVVDALSRKNMGDVSSLVVQPEFFKDLERLQIDFCVHHGDGLLSNLTIELILVSRVKEAQQHDGEHWAIQQKIKDGSQADFRIDDQGVIWSKTGYLYLMF